MAAPVRNVRDLLARRWGVTFTSRDRELSVPTTRVQLVQSNPTRAAMLVTNDGTFTVAVGPAPGPPVSLSIRIDPNGGSLFVWWEEDGERVSEEWLATALGGGSGVHIYELLLEGPGAVAGAVAT